MRIRDVINRRKEKFKAQRTIKSQQDNIRKAEELQRLRLERQKYEGKAKLNRLIEEENIRIEKAKGPSNLQKFGAGLTKVVNKQKAKQSKRVVPKSGNKLRQINQGSGGIQFGGSGNSNFEFTPTNKN